MPDQLVLVAHSAPAVRLLIRHVIELLGGLLVIEAADGETAIETVRRLRPGLLLVSPTLPRIDGLQVCRRLKADPATQTVPVIVVSGADSRDEAVAAGADDFLPMPFNVAQLTDEIRHHVRLEERLH